MRYQGRISSWKDEQGFGFITPNAGGAQIFVHIKSFASRDRRPAGNEIVTYELKTAANGRLQAEGVAFVGGRRPSKVAAGRGDGSGFSLLFVAGFFALVGGLAFAGKLPLLVLWLYCSASVITFAVYGLDKSAAKNDRWRTQETTLHLLALIGGWPGALVAQKLLRHKSKKAEFQTVFWVTVVLNCGALVALFSTSGAALLGSVMDAI